MARGCFLWALLHCARGEDQSCAATPGAASCQCQEGDDAADCAALQFARLAEWMQAGVDQYVQEDYRAEAPRISDVLKVTGERAVVAARALEEGELFLRLPKQRLLHAGYYRNGSESPLIAKLSQALQERGEQVPIETNTWLSLYLLEQRRLGPRSPWSTWLALLPPSFPSVPLFYGDAELRWLEGSLFVRRVQRRHRELARQFQSVSELLPGFGEEYALQDFLWAQSNALSRVFGYGQTIPDLPGGAMVPLGDMFNHDFPKELTWSYNTTTDTFDYRVSRNVPEGSEVHISYGSNCNSRYLLDYGFALPDVHRYNPRRPSLSTAGVALHLDSDVPDRDVREKWLLEHRSGDDEDKLGPQEFSLTQAWDSSIAKLLGYARLISLEPEDFTEMAEHRHRNCSASSTPPACRSSNTLQMERKALRRVLAALDAQLDGYPTTLDEDEALLPGLSGVPRFLVLLRRDEKLVLRRWQDVFRIFVSVAESALHLPSPGVLSRCRKEMYANHEGSVSEELRYVKKELLVLRERAAGEMHVE